MVRRTLLLLLALALTSAVVFAAAPAAPAGLSATATSATQVQLKWSDPNKGGGNKFQVERSKSSNAGFALVGTTPQVNFSDPGAVAGTTYYYRVRTVKGNDVSAYSALASTTTPTVVDTTAPSIPIGVSATAASCQAIKLSWAASTDAASGVKAYNVYRNGALLRQVASPATTTSDTGLTASTNYSYSVSAIDNAGNESAKSVPATASTPACPDTTAPSIPGGLVAVVASCQEIDLAWNASSDAGSGMKAYNLYRNGVLLNQFAAASTSASDAGLSASTAYSYSVTAVDVAGNESGSSNVAKASTPACPNPKTPVSGTSVTDTLIDNGTLGESATIGARGRMAEIGNLQAQIYDQGYGTDKYLYVRDDLGNASWVYLPDLTGDMLFKAEYLFTSETEFWIFSSNGMPAFGWVGAPAVARQYSLQGSPLPTTATLVSKVSFGDSASGAGSLIKLKSGGLAGMWYRPNPNSSDPSTNWVDVGFVYRDPHGAWSAASSVRVDGFPDHTHNMTLVQHPADDSIWAFSRGDSFSTIWAIHLTETASGLRVDWADKNFISETGDGDNGPEGEIPYLVAMPDPTRNAIQLAYQNNKYKYFSTSPRVVKGAFVSIAQIAGDGGKTFVTLPTYVERVSTLGLIVTPDKIWLSYRPINPGTLTFTDVYAASYSNGVWNPPLYLGTTDATIRNLIAYGVNRVSFALGLSDWTVHMFDIQ